MTRKIVTDYIIHANVSVQMKKRIRIFLKGEFNLCIFRRKENQNNVIHFNADIGFKAHNYIQFTIIIT